MGDRMPDHIEVGPNGQILTTYDLGVDQTVPVDGSLRSFTVGAVALSSQGEWSVYLDLGLVPFGHEHHDHAEKHISLALDTRFAQRLADALEQVLNDLPGLEPPPTQLPRPEDGWGG